MDKFIINGGGRLKGQVTISGAKNAALPIMAAALLTSDETVIHGVPGLADVRHLGDLLEKLGAPLRRDENNSLHIKVEDESHSLADYDSVRRMRASICVQQAASVAGADGYVTARRLFSMVPPGLREELMRFGVLGG